LRAWERRYGLPQPSRTESGHRLYSERDIAIIHWLNERLDEGLRIKQAVNLWKEMESSGQDPLIVRPIATHTSEPQKKITGESPALSDIRDGWINAILNFDEESAENIINYAFALYPIETVCFEVLLDGLATIGEAWYQGEASVQQEHFASSLVIRRLDALIAASPPPTRPGTVLVACPPGDEHTIAPLMLTLMLRQRGWKVVYLGANVPKSRFEETIRSIKPLIVILTAQHLKSAASLLDLAEYLTQKEVRVAFGGLIFNRNPELSTAISGYYLGNQLKNAIQSLEEVLTTVPPLPEPSPRFPNSPDIIDYYNKIRLKIEAEVLDNLNLHDMDADFFMIANHFLSENIEAAMRIGDLDLLKPELIWVDELIRNYQIKPEIVNQYLNAYLKSAESIMDDRGALILQWLKGWVDNQD